MPHFTDNHTLEQILYAAVALLVLYLGYRLGRFFGSLAGSREIARKEQELFTAQKGFKTLYETEIGTLKGENEKLREQLAALQQRVEDYRKKAAGLGGLFSSGGKKADAMTRVLAKVSPTLMSFSSPSASCRSLSARVIRR